MTNDEAKELAHRIADTLDEMMVAWTIAEPEIRAEHIRMARQNLVYRLADALLATRM